MSSVSPLTTIARYFDAEQFSDSEFGQSATDRAPARGPDQHEPTDGSGSDLLASLRSQGVELGLFALHDRSAHGPSLKDAPAPETTGEAGVKPQDVAPPPPTREEQEKAARDAAQARIQQIMGNYDPEDDDADAKAEQIANDPELRKYLTPEQRAQLIRGLFDGSTSEGEEDAAMRLLESASGEDLKKVVGAIGWEELSDELDDHDLTAISAMLANATQTGGPASNAALESLGILPADRDPKFGLEADEFDAQIRSKLKPMTPEEIRQLADQLIGDKKLILKEIAEAERRGPDSKAEKLRATLAVLKEHAPDELKAKLVQFSWQVHYTARLGQELRRGNYAELLRFLPDLTDPHLSKEQRVALYETLDNLKPEIRAMEAVVNHIGEPNQKAQMQRFMSTYNAFMDSFKANVPPADRLPTILGKLGRVAQGIEGQFQELKSTVDGAIAEAKDVFNIGQLLGTKDDDEARELVQFLLSQGLLGNVPTALKVELINKMINTPFYDGTLDGDEQAILHILEETKKTNPEEFYQIVAAVGFENLDGGIDGEEWDSFLRLLAQ
jgi:hypothetical protein